MHACIKSQLRGHSCFFYADGGGGDVLNVLSPISLLEALFHCGWMRMFTVLLHCCHSSNPNHTTYPEGRKQTCSLLCRIEPQLYARYTILVNPSLRYLSSNESSVGHGIPTLPLAADAR